MKTYCRLRDENATLVQLVYYCLASYYQSCLQAAGVFKVWICSHTYMFVCVCVCGVFVFVCVCVCLCTYIRTYVFIYASVCVRRRVLAFVGMRAVVLILYCHDGPWPIRHNE